MASRKYPQVSQVYTGRKGCACGCRGNYTENPSTIGKVMKVLEANAARLEYTTGINGELVAFVDVGQRAYTVYARAKASLHPLRAAERKAIAKAAVVRR